MSAQTTDTSDVEWILKGINKIQYTMAVRKMDEKIKSFQPGRKTSSKDFKIGMSTFCIVVYPGGTSEENDKFVGLYLRNKSGWRVKVKGSFAIPQTDISRALPATVFKSRLSNRTGFCGFKDMIPHYRCVKEDLLSEIGTLTFHVSVELIGEEVSQGRDPSKEHTIERLEKLEQQTAELKRMIQDLPQAQSSLSMVECPVCMEVARPPMRLKECGQVHIICDNCQSRAGARASDEGGRGNPNIANCHSCRGMITGRPAALERALGLI